jgi:hypothetical protein
MPYQFNVLMPDNSHYAIKSILAKARSNTKLAKSDAAMLGYRSASLSFAPADMAGFDLLGRRIDVCTSRSVGCGNACLVTSGLADVFPTIIPARIARTRFYKLHKSEFTDRLFKELAAFERYCAKHGVKPAVRMNVLSDVMWEREVPSLFERFPNVQFYDYTKHYNRMLRFIAGNFPANYDLTFSRSENNEEKCLEVLRRGGNVAIPFMVRRSGNLPESYKGYPIFNADETDLRFLDPKGGRIAGLRVKGRKGKKDQTGFIVGVA